MSFEKRYKEKLWKLGKSAAKSGEMFRAKSLFVITSRFLNHTFWSWMKQVADIIAILDLGYFKNGGAVHKLSVMTI